MVNYKLLKPGVKFIFEKNFFWLLVVLLHIFFFSLQVKNKNLYLADSFEYLKASENIRDDFYFYCGDKEEPFNPDLLTKRTPLYPLFIVAVKFINNSDFLVLFFQSILSLFNIFILVKVAEKFNVNNYFLILILLIFTPSQFIYTHFVMSEILFQTFLVMAFLCILLFLEKKAIKYLFFYNIFLIFAMLTKAVLYLFVIPNFFFLIYLAFKKKKFKIMVTGFIPILCVLGYCNWNYHRTGYFHYSSIQKINLLNYNTYYFLINNKGEEIAKETIEKIDKEAENISSYKEKSEYMKEQAFNIIIRENFLSYSIFHLKGVLNFFLDPGRHDFQNLIGVRKSKGKGLWYHYSKSGYRGIISFLKEQSVFFVLLLMSILFFNLLKFLGLLLFSINKEIEFEVRLFVLILVGYISFATGPLGISRFAMPLLPILIFAFLNSWNSFLHKK